MTKNPGISFEIARISFYDNREKEEGDNFPSMVFRRDQALNMFEIENVLYLLQKWSTINALQRTTNFEKGLLFGLPFSRINDII